MTTSVVCIDMRGQELPVFLGRGGERQGPQILLISSATCLFQLIYPFLLAQALVHHLFMV